MIIFPALDIKDNRCVRLSQGDFKRVKTYSHHPLEIALNWQDQGAKFIHIVDLDGAKDGVLTNRKSIENIVSEISIPIQIGGGIRNEEMVRTLLEIGVNRVILGTLAIEDRKLLERLISKYHKRIVVSIDAKDGKVATRGWEVVSKIDSIVLCKDLEKMGLDTIVYTDILRDGMLRGPNLEVYEQIIKDTNLNLIASGGITTLDDIHRLKVMKVYGAIIGKALYEEKLTLKEVMACLQEE